MMGFCRIFFLEGPFWRFFGMEDLFFFFWSSRPILSWFGGARRYQCIVFGVAEALVATSKSFGELSVSVIDNSGRPTEQARPVYMMADP
jgi:hypothetical protein